MTNVKIKKIFTTEFKVNNKVFNGPMIYAETLEEAEWEADMIGLIVVGILDINIEEDVEERVIH
tara:strand:+ start:746 stop:937 length:192 start_codon:yes stop_codon:yes gene_type:complete